MPSLPLPILAAKPHDWFRDGHNIREIVIGDGLKDLARSLAAHGFLQPLGAVDHGEYGELLYGFRRLAAYRWGLEEKLALPEAIPVQLYPPSLTTTLRRVITAMENLQREDLDDPQIYRLCKELTELNPEWTRKDLAAHLNKSPATITLYLSPDDLEPEPLAAFLAGEFGFSVAYAISRAPDQRASLAQRRSKNGSRAELERANRKHKTGNGKAGTVTARSISMVLGNGMTVTFKAVEAITLSMALDVLTDARKELDDAIKRDHDARTFNTLMKKRARQFTRDKAKAGA